MIDKKILAYNVKMLTAWLTFDAGCSNPEYFNAHKGTLGLELQQVPGEYSQLLDWLRKQNFESYLELGVGRGGSFLMNVMFQPNLKWGTAIDSSEYWKESQKSDIESKISWLQEQGKPVKFFDLTTDEAFSRMEADAPKIDCIFIDADHSYEGVKKDYDNALKHIKDGGYIIFHDIASAQCPGVQQIWKEATEKHTAVHVFVHGNNCGIGIIQVSINEKIKELPFTPWQPPTNTSYLVDGDKLHYMGEGIATLTQIESMMLNKTKYGVLLIETRPEVNLQEVADRHMNFLPESWGLTIIGSKENEQVPCGAMNRIHVNVKDFTVGILNKWLTSPYFWSLIPHEKILVIQPDSQLLRKGIEEFLEWDYIGAPWKLSHFGGNGGLSLRTVEVMKTICEKNIYGGEGVHGNEDIFFSNIMNQHGIGKLAPRYICEKFSCESIFKLGTLGEHAANKYVSPEEYNQILTQYK